MNSFYFVRSLGLNTRDPFSRLARSTCCQRPIRVPPERRVSVEPLIVALASIKCPRKPFLSYRFQRRLSTLSQTAVFQTVCNHSGELLALLNAVRGACGKITLSWRRFVAHGIPRESSYFKKSFREVCDYAKPFENHCSRILVPWPEPTS
jgi:hypothetical protein